MKTIGDVLKEAAKLKERSTSGLVREDPPAGLGAWASMPATAKNIDRLLALRPDIKEFFDRPGRK